MACYTLSNCIILNLGIGKKYITDLLMVFTRESNAFKVAVDKSGRIIDLYERGAEKNEHVASWLSLMSYQPSKFETINIDVRAASNEEEVFLMVCSHTKSQQKLIVHSHEGWENHNYNSDKVMLYNEKHIRVFDRDEAVIELNYYTTGSITAYGSVIATNNSVINETKNNK